MVIDMETLISIANFCLYGLLVVWGLGYLLMVGEVVYKRYQSAYVIDSITQSILKSNRKPDDFSTNAIALSIVIGVGICIYKWTPFDPLAYGLFIISFAHFLVTPILARWYYQYTAVTLKA
jgi:hypothetical protein